MDKLTLIFKGERKYVLMKIIFLLVALIIDTIYFSSYITQRPTKSCTALYNLSLSLGILLTLLLITFIGKQYFDYKRTKQKFDTVNLGEEESKEHKIQLIDENEIEKKKCFRCCSINFSLIVIISILLIIM